jgi:glycosyltransferase involved in cell wall biosynthesis
VDAVFSLTDIDTAYARQFNNLVLRIPVCTSVELFDAARARRAPRRDDRVILGWVGSRGTFAALEYVRDALDAVGEQFPRAELRVVGAGADFRSPLRHLRCTARPEYDEAAMIEEILGMDVGLYPPPLDLEDYRIRGPQKALLYMTGRVPPVCESAGDWTGLIKDGVNGMLASGPAEWAEKIGALVASPELRSRVGGNAYAMVREEYSLAKVFGVLEEALLTVLRAPSGRTAA